MRKWQRVSPLGRLQSSRDPGKSSARLLQAPNIRPDHTRWKPSARLYTRADAEGVVYRGDDFVDGDLAVVVGVAEETESKR